ncbi:hypothetical protein JYU34_011472 [Plutella xylostella]|uniref:Uncharacterized protein n=1 Tax=Plutella xylostella TaxID=51655 RepID=A0ABQ7QH25_PLUXY|nr:hypothetical protein JYU34_011472 [Plutella xylostella]
MKEAFTFHLGAAVPCTADECEGGGGAARGGARGAGGARAFLRLTSLVELDAFTLTHPPFTPIDTPGMQPGKRKLGGHSLRAARGRQPAYFLPELAHVVAAADERVPTVNLAQEVGPITAPERHASTNQSASCPSWRTWWPRPTSACPPSTWRRR